jgi:hypothetical protein
VQVNDLNQVGGYADSLTNSHLIVPARWQNGIIRRFTVGSSGTSGIAQAIDHAGGLFGQVVESSGYRDMAYWSPAGALTTFSNSSGLQPRFYSASASGNAAGDSASASNFQEVEALAPKYKLSSLPGGTQTCSVPLSINDAGEVAYVENACGTGTASAVRLQDGSVQHLKVFVSTGNELNDNGDAAGLLVNRTGGLPSATSGIESAIGTFEKLKPLHSGDGVDVQAINDSDLAVGYETGPSSTYTAVAWIDGKVIPVASLVDGGFKGTLTAAIDVNNNGSILVDGYPEGSSAAETYLLSSPLPYQLRGTAWLGSDGEHVKTPRQAAGGVVVHVTGVTDEHQVVDEATETNGAGEYQFTLQDGTYTLSVEEGACVKGVPGCVTTKKFVINGTDEQIDVVAPDGGLKLTVKPIPGSVILHSKNGVVIAVTIKVSVTVRNVGKTTLPDVVAQPVMLTSYAGEAALSLSGIPLLPPLRHAGGPTPASLGPLSPNAARVATYELSVKGAGMFLLEALVIGHNVHHVRVIGDSAALLTVVTK